MSKDIRVLIIKLADTLHNLRTINYLSDAKVKEKCRDTLEIYAPLASRLGMDNKKAEDLLILHIEEKASFADYFVLASGKSERQIGALADDVQDAYAKEGVIAKSIEGKKESGWILMSTKLK